MTSLKKKLLILGAGNAQIDLIEYAKKLGLEVHVCSYSNTDKGIPLADSFAQINIVDTDRIEAYVRENQIDFVYSVGSDIAVPTVCRVAERTGKFHFVSGRTAELCCNKYHMREALGMESDYNVPYMVCGSLSEAEEADFYPFMVKPVDSQGQRGVRCVKQPSELESAFHAAMEYSRCGQVILEQYLDGPEVSVNAYMKDGEVIFFKMSDRESCPELPGGIIKAHHLPSVFEGTETHRKIRCLVNEAAACLEIKNGPVYFQIKICDGHPYVIEVTPRLDGCHMWRLIKAYCGVDLLEMSMTHLLTGSVSVPVSRENSGFWHLEFVNAPPGSVFQEEKAASGEYEYRNLYYETGDLVPRINGYMEKCGYQIVRSSRKVGLIGGSGLIGTGIQKQYADKACFVNISRKAGTVTDYSEEELEQALRGCDSAVLLAAKKVNPKEAQTLTQYGTNVEITEHTLQACRKLGIKNIVYLSTRCVYGSSQKSPVKETGQIAPINVYGISKYTGELLCEYYNRVHGMKIKILRLAQIIGNEKNGYMLDTFIQNARSGRPLSVFGRSVGQRDYLYVKDACRAIWCALDHYASSGVYNIGSGAGTTNLELAEAVIRGFHSISAVSRQPDQPEDSTRIWLDMEKAKKDLGFFPEYHLTDAFADMGEEMVRDE